MQIEILENCWDTTRSTLARLHFPLTKREAVEMYGEIDEEISEYGDGDYVIRGVKHISHSEDELSYFLNVDFVIDNNN